MLASRIVAAALGIALLGGCTTVVDGNPVAGARNTGPTSFPSYVRSTPSLPPSTVQIAIRRAITTPWITASDGKAGIRFQLPARPSSSGQAVVRGRRSYACDLYANDLAVSVDVTDTPDIYTSRDLMKSYPDRIIAGFPAAEGTTDFALTERRLASYHDYYYTEMRIGFTPPSDPATTTIWLIRAMAVGPDVVVLQTEATVPKSEQNADLVVVRELQGRLTSHLVVLP